MPTRPAYAQRLLAHRVGHYYGLATCIVEVNGQKGCLQLSKGPNACIPEVRCRVQREQSLRGARGMNPGGSLEQHGKSSFWPLGGIVC